MREIDASNTIPYLHDTGRIPASLPCAVRELSGGVSNIVLRVDAAGRAPMVLKQCRERLRVAMEWLAPLDRIWTERAALGVLGEILPRGTVPELLFEDRENYLFAMTCAPEGAVTWKSLLMAGEANAAVAEEAGRLLGLVHTRSVDHPALETTLADVSLFESLRIDPYYRTVARAHPDLAESLERLIGSMAGAKPDAALVLGDYSPKNILVAPEGGMARLILLDFECAHAGDPAFDLGFCMSHLILKLYRMGGAEEYAEVARRFLAGYGAGMSGGVVSGRVRHARLVRGARHAAACLLARLDGKSPVEYRGELDQEAVRRLGREVLLGEQAADVLSMVERAAREGAGS